MAGHLTMSERDRIVQLSHDGFQQKEIARSLGRSRSTISREFRRNRTNGGYHAAQAQERSRQRRRDRPLVRKMDDPTIGPFVRQGLASEWSPEQIAGRIKVEHPQDSRLRISHQTVYSWIRRSRERAHWSSFLRRRGKRPYRRKRSMFGAPIANRPQVIEERQRLGDFEGDTVLGPPGTGGLATLVDRKSRYSILSKVRSKNADHVHRRIKQRLRSVSADKRHSLTLDNGTEFARCPRLEKHLAVKVYYAEPGRPYQRGTNENTNGLIRQYFPKGRDFRKVSPHDVRRVEKLLNDRPRACLGFRTPHEVFFEKSPPSGCD